MDPVQEGSTGNGAANGSSSIEFARRAALLAQDLHCEDVRLLDVRGLSQICDFGVLQILQVAARLLCLFRHRLLSYRCHCCYAVLDAEIPRFGPVP